ncbi:hypothetical protein ACFL6C_06630 [Myxococcota bacterium]
MTPPNSYVRTTEVRAAGDVLAWLRQHPALQRPSPQPRARLPTGLSSLDTLLGGGLPRGAITEVIGPGSSGRTALTMAVLAATSQREVVAWVDPVNALDPVSVRGAGMCLERFLWIRPTALKQALKAVDLVLDAGGFAALVLDLAGAHSTQVSRPAWWVRLTRRLEPSRTALITLALREVTSSSAALRLTCHRGQNQTVRVRVLRQRGRAPGGLAQLELAQPVD